MPNVRWRCRWLPSLRQGCQQSTRVERSPEGCLVLGDSPTLTNLEAVVTCGVAAWDTLVSVPYPISSRGLRSRASGAGSWRQGLTDASSGIDTAQRRAEDCLSGYVARG